MKRIALSFILASAVVAPSAFAEGSKVEASVYGNLSSSTASYSGATAVTSTVIGLTGGYYITPKLVVNALVMVNGTETSGYDSQTLNIGGGVKFYFGNSAKNAVVPFVLGDIVIVSTSGTSSATGYGMQAGGGVSYFITEALSADVTGKLTYNSMSSSGTSFTTTGGLVNFGLTARF